jgi:hypothetical protein
MNELICSLCERVFDTQDRLPRLFPNCGHTFCSLCVESLILDSGSLPICPEDDIECTNFKTEKGINSFPINVTLQRLLKNRKEHPPQKAVEKLERGTRISDYSGIQFCSDHQKVADLVCRTDRNVICSDCALFGDHRSHDYIRSDDFKSLIKEKAMNLGVELDKLKKKSFAHKNDRRIDELNNKVTAKKEEILTIISEKFALVEEELRKKEIELKDKINCRIEKFSEALEYVCESAKGLREKEDVVKNKLQRTNTLLKNTSIDYRFLLDNYYDNYDLFAIVGEVSKEYDRLEKHAREIIDNELEKIQVTGEVSHLLEGIWNSLSISCDENSRKSLTYYPSNGQLLPPGLTDNGIHKVDSLSDIKRTGDLLCIETPVEENRTKKVTNESNNQIDSSIAIQTEPDSLSISQIYMNPPRSDQINDNLKSDRNKKQLKGQSIYSEKKPVVEIAEKTQKSNSMANAMNVHPKSKKAIPSPQVLLQPMNKYLGSSTLSPNKQEKDLHADGPTESHLSAEKYDHIYEEPERNDDDDENVHERLGRYEPSDIEINKSATVNDTIVRPQLDIDNSKSLLDEDFDEDDDHSLMKSDSEESDNQNMSINAKHNQSKNQSLTKNRGQSPILTAYKNYMNPSMTRPSNSLYQQGSYYNNNFNQTTMKSTQSQYEAPLQHNDSLLKNSLNKPYDKKQGQVIGEKLLEQTRMSNNSKNINPNLMNIHRQSMIQNPRLISQNTLSSNPEISNSFYQYSGQMPSQTQILSNMSSSQMSMTMPFNQMTMNDSYSMNNNLPNHKMFNQMAQMNQYGQMQQGNLYGGNSPNLQMSNVSHMNYQKMKMSSLRDDDMNSQADYEREKSPLANQKFTKKTTQIPSGKTLGSETDSEVNMTRMNINDSKLVQILTDIAKNKKMRILNLSYNFITDIGVEHVLKKLSSHPALEKIILTGNFIEESIFQKIEEAAKTFRKINYLNFQENKGFKNMAKIKKHISNLKRLGVKIEV